MGGVRVRTGGDETVGQAPGAAAAAGDGRARKLTGDPGAILHRVQAKDTVASVRQTYYPDEQRRSDVSATRRDEVLRRVLEDTGQLAPGAALGGSAGSSIELPSPAAFEALAKLLDKIGGLKDGVAGKSTRKLLEKAVKATHGTVRREAAPAAPPAPRAREAAARPRTGGAKAGKPAGKTPGKVAGRGPAKAAGRTTGKISGKAAGKTTAKVGSSAPAKAKPEVARPAAVAKAAPRAAQAAPVATPKPSGPAHPEATAVLREHLSRMVDVARRYAAQGLELDAHDLASSWTQKRVTVGPELVSSLARLPAAALDAELRRVVEAELPADAQMRQELLAAARAFLEERLPQIAAEEVRREVLAALAETSQTFAELIAVPAALNRAVAVIGLEDEPAMQQAALAVREGLGLDGVDPHDRPAVRAALARRRREIEETRADLARSTASPMRAWEELSAFEDTREVVRARLGVADGSCLARALDRVATEGEEQAEKTKLVREVTSIVAVSLVSITTAGVGGLAAGVVANALVNLPEQADKQAAVAKMRALVSARLADSGAASAAERQAHHAPIEYAVGIAASTWVGHQTEHVLTHGILEKVGKVLGHLGIKAAEIVAHHATHSAVKMLFDAADELLHPDLKDPSYRNLIGGLQRLRAGSAAAAAARERAVEGAFDDAGVPEQPELRSALLARYLVDRGLESDQPAALRAALAAWLKGYAAAAGG